MIYVGCDGDYRVYGPGDAHYGSITIRCRLSRGHGNEGGTLKGTTTGEMYEWWQNTVREKTKGKVWPKDITYDPPSRRNRDGKDVRKDITVKLLREGGDQDMPIVEREYIFIDCELKSFTSYEIEEDSGEPVVTIVAQPNDIMINALDVDSDDDSLPTMATTQKVQAVEQKQEEVVNSPFKDEVLAAARTAQIKNIENNQVRIDLNIGSDSHEGGWKTINGGGVRIHEGVRGRVLGTGSQDCVIIMDSDGSVDTSTGATCTSLSVDTLTVGGDALSGRKALFQWIQANARRGARGIAPRYKNVAIKEILKDGADGKSTYFLYEDGFLTRYKFPKLSASGKGNLYEEVSIKPIRLELA